MKELNFLTGGQPIRLDDLERMHEYAKNAYEIVRNTNFFNFNKEFTIISTRPDGEITESETVGSVVTYTIYGGNLIHVSDGDFVIPQDLNNRTYTLVESTVTGSTPTPWEQLYVTPVYVYEENDTDGNVLFYDNTYKDVWPSRYAYVGYSPPSGATQVCKYGDLVKPTERRLLINRLDIVNKDDSDFNTDYGEIKLAEGSTITGNLIPTYTFNRDIGTSGDTWETLYVDNIDVGNMVSDVIPDTTNTYDLGSSSLKWKDLYLAGNISISGNIIGNITPSTTNTYDLGTSSNKWKDLYLAGDISISGNITGNITPSTTNTYDLGSTSNEFRTIHTKSITNNGVSIAKKIITIGDWNMDASGSIAVNHGLTLSTIRRISVIIRNDENNSYYDLGNSNSTGTAAGTIQSINSSYINLGRTPSGIFDSTSYDSIDYNRGWVTIEYEV